MKKEQSVINICNEIAEQGRRGNCYDLIRVKARVDEYLKEK